MSRHLTDAQFRAMIEARVERLETALDVERARAAEDRAVALAGGQPASPEPGQPAPTSDARRDAILARIAEALPRPDDGTGLHDGGSTCP